MEVKGKEFDKEKTYAPHFEGDKLGSENGPILSMFALTEIIEKIRENQRISTATGPDVDGPTSDISNILTSIKALLDEKHYKIVSEPPASFRCIGMQSTEYILVVDKYFEEISAVGDDIDENEPEKFFEAMLKKVRFIREKGAFIIQGVPTRDYRGHEVVSSKALGIEFEHVLSHLTAPDRQVIQQAQDAIVVENDFQGDRPTDSFMVAMSDPIYRVHCTLQGYIERIQVNVMQQSINWLDRLGRRKRFSYSNKFLTDFRRSDTIMIITTPLPFDTNMLWAVPRCHVPNLLMNIATCMPEIEFLNANSRIASITITQRITQNNPFSIISGMTPTSQQLDDVKKIYLALMYPNQIVLDLRVDPTHVVDPVLRMIAGVLGHIMFTHGPNFTNITVNMARLLDQALEEYLTYAYNARTPIVYGASGQTLDFHIGQRNPFDCNQLRSDPLTGRGYNGWNVNDTVRRQPAPYDHVQRWIQYCNIDSREIIHPQTYGHNMSYPMVDLLIRALVAANKEQEAAFIKQMLPYHMTRFARINGVINDDLLSGFSLPDEQFDAVLPDMLQGNHTDRSPIVLEVGWASIWFAYNRRMEPTQRNSMLCEAPLIEATYASHLAVLQHDMRQLDLLRARAPEMVLESTPSQFWRAALSVAPEPIKQVMNLVSSFRFVNIRDIMRWVRRRERYETMLMELEEVAWAVAADLENLMITDRIYMHRDILPEPPVDDVVEFRRQGFYHTNQIVAAPPLDRINYYSYEVALMQANMGRFKLAIRQILDRDETILFGGALRSIKLQIFESKPPDEILTQLPYQYEEQEEEGLRYVKLKYAVKSTLYVLIYKAEYGDTPDRLIGVNPTYTMTQIHLTKQIVRKVRSPDILGNVNRRVVGYKGKMRVMDITSALRLGARLAVPTI
uniref:VP3 n=1 Tax=Equine encephalosis virus 5 TaxID=201495 RepID=A0A7U1BC81_9REOV|nr:VP3 [Equine encephalosis virus 5]